MKRADFIRKTEAVYGKYDAVYKTALASYLSNLYTDDQLNSLFFKVLETVIPGLNKCLSIPALENIRLKDVEMKAENTWLSLINKSCVPDTMILDYASYRAIASYGSWARFCQARDSNREWTHKDFVNRYKVFARRNIKEEPRLLVGSAHEVAGAFGAPIQIIGDEEEGKRFLENKKPDTTEEKLLGFIKKVEDEEKK